MTKPFPGMDHDLYPFSAIDQREPLQWPEVADIAFTVLLHLEYWELEPPADSWRDPRFQGAFPTFFPDYTAFSQREYGNRVGIFRVLDIIDRYDLKLSVLANQAAIARYPRLVSALLERQVEFVAHGSHANRMITSKLSNEEQIEIITACVSDIENATGQRPTGWAGPGYGEAWDTAALVADCGLTYVADWPNDDQPYVLNTEPALISIPRQPEWDDVEALWLRHLPTQSWPGLVQEAFERLALEGRQSGRYFSLSLHPWLIGQAHRIRYLDAVLHAITQSPARVWQTTTGAVASHLLHQKGGTAP